METCEPAAQEPTTQLILCPQALAFPFQGLGPSCTPHAPAAATSTSTPAQTSCSGLPEMTDGCSCPNAISQLPS